MKKVILIASLLSCVAFWIYKQNNNTIATLEERAPASATKIFKYYEEGYKCLNLNGETIETHRDALLMQENGDICRLGNGCNDSIHCDADLDSLTVSADQRWLAFDGHIYMRE